MEVVIVVQLYYVYVQDGSGDDRRRRKMCNPFEPVADGGRSPVTVHDINEHARKHIHTDICVYIYTHTFYTSERKKKSQKKKEKNLHTHIICEEKNIYKEGK